MIDHKRKNAFARRASINGHLRLVFLAAWAAMAGACSASSPDAERNGAASSATVELETTAVVAPAEEERPVRMDEIEEAQQMDTTGGEPSADLLHACFAAPDWRYGGRLQVLSSHTPLSDLSSFMVASWEEAPDGIWILRATQADPLTRTTNEYAASIGWGRNDLSQPYATCGPKMAAVTRLAINGQVLTPREADEVMMQIVYASQRAKG